MTAIRRWAETDVRNLAEEKIQTHTSKTQTDVIIHVQSRPRVPPHTSNGGLCVLSTHQVIESSSPPTGSMSMSAIISVSFFITHGVQATGTQGRQPCAGDRGQLRRANTGEHKATMHRKIRGDFERPGQDRRIVERRRYNRQYLWQAAGPKEVEIQTKSKYQQLGTTSDCPPNVLRRAPRYVALRSSDS